MSVNLEELGSKITSLGETIVTLKKSAEPDKDAIGAAVKDLLDAKKLYADNNNGIGADGKPYEPPMTKAEKKAKAKAEKAKTAGAAKPKSDPNSAGSKKKAAKKAEAKAKKAAAKAAGGGAGGESAAPPQSNAGNQKPVAAATTPNKKAPVKKRTIIPSKSKLRPNQISFNPNSELTDRPVMSLLVACLTNTINDIEIISDHTRNNGPGFGLPDGGELAGDAAIARYLARRLARRSGAESPLLGGTCVEQMALVDSFVDYANSLSKFQSLRRVKAVSATLTHMLKEKTFVVGHSMTLADISLYAAMGFPAQASDANQVKSIIGSSSKPTLRWMDMMGAHPSVREATQLAMGISNDLECTFEDGVALDPLFKGMSPLEGATPGNVVTRFPPEPSGYLHVGHAKAVLMNEYYARRYKGRLIVRFDDTNPSKEKEEFQASILEDLEMLGVKPDVVTFTSDYFETIYKYAMFLIENNLAFMDDTPQEEMQKERMDRVESKHRNQSVEDCKKYFADMCSGSEEGSNWCLRAKIDMKSVNGTMRDPVLYRQNTLPHHRAGTQFKAYPTYDLACPIVDSIEGVTHALRTTEYNDRDEQYQWIQSALGIRRVRIHAFARMNFMYTELSKRKLGWFVDNGIVTGWDDARFPTVRGVIRRGVNLDALRSFICSQGASRRIVNMEWGKFWASNKKEIDKEAKRFMAIDQEDHVTLTVTNGPNAEDNCFLSTDFLPKDPSFGKRLVRIAKEVALEKVDTEGMVVGEDIVLMRWGVVKITKVEGGLEGEFLEDGDFKSAKKKLSWMAKTKENISVKLTEFDNLIVKEKLDEGDNFQDYINPNTIASSMVIGDPGLKNLQKNEIIQLERRGYYRVDEPYMSEEKGISLFMIPDGKAKAMSGLSGKLAHR